MTTAHIPKPVKQKKILTLCMICDYDKNLISLGMKKRGLGVGLWNGFGGKVMAEESIEQALIRECHEEAMITPRLFEKVVVLNIESTDPALDIMEVHTFIATTWSGEPAESDEMRPEWFAIDAIPYDEMWPADVHWLPRVLNGERLTAYFLIGEQGQVINHQVEVVGGL